jgi:hypothetical protein
MRLTCGCRPTGGWRAPIRRMGARGNRQITARGVYVPPWALLISAALGIDVQNHPKLRRIRCCKAISCRRQQEKHVGESKAAQLQARHQPDTFAAKKMVETRSARKRKGNAVQQQSSISSQTTGFSRLTRDKRRKSLSAGDQGHGRPMCLALCTSISSTALSAYI